MLKQTEVKALPVGTPVETHNGKARKNDKMRGLILEAQKASVGYLYLVGIPRDEWDRLFRPTDLPVEVMRFYDDEVTTIGQAPEDATALFEQVYQTGRVDWAALAELPEPEQEQAAGRFRYYLLYRPPFVGTHPAENEIARDVWMPQRHIPGTKIPAFGWVEYSQPLDARRVDSYELRPAEDS